MAKETAAKKLEFGRFDFVKAAPIMGGISLLATVLAAYWIMTKGFNYGIDFAGGTEVQVRFEQPVAQGDLRKTIIETGISEPTVQSFGDDKEYLIRLESVRAESEKEMNVKLKEQIAKLTTAMKSKFALKDDGIRRVDTVGPQVGSELKRNGLLAAFYSFLVILIYVAVRFDYKYAPGAVLCLVHDSIVTLGVFSLLGREVNVQIMAAVLTLIGYSLNDTIVTFDRIRETYPTYRDYGMPFVINKSINDMFVRTLMTSFMTLLAVTMLMNLGGGVISEIAFTLFIGIIIGTYSSIYVASPLILIMDKLKGARA